MFGHLLNNTVVLPGVNTVYFYTEYIQKWKLAAAAYMAVDSFLLVGGIVLGYVATDKVNNIFQINNGNYFGLFLTFSGFIKWIIFYITRWIR